MKQIFLSLIILLIVFSSCNNSVVTKEFNQIANKNWDRFEKQYFKIQLKESDKYYDYYLLINYTDENLEKNIPIYAILTLPSGEERFREVNIAFNKTINNKKDNTFQAEVLLWSEVYNSKSGIANIEIETFTPKIELPGISDVGIRIEKSKIIEKE